MALEYVTEEIQCQNMMFPQDCALGQGWGSQLSKPLSETVRLSIGIHSTFYGLPPAEQDD